jgi:hypothetical protein
MTERTPADLIRETRDLPARNALSRYIVAYERFAELEQMHKLLGNWADAEGAHAYGLILLRAIKGESDA